MCTTSSASLVPSQAGAKATNFFFASQADPGPGGIALSAKEPTQSPTLPRASSWLTIRRPPQLRPSTPTPFTTLLRLVGVGKLGHLLPFSCPVLVRPRSCLAIRHLGREGCNIRCQAVRRADQLHDYSRPTTAKISRLQHHDWLPSRITSIFHFPQRHLDHQCFKDLEPSPLREAPPASPPSFPLFDLPPGGIAFQVTL